MITYLLLNLVFMFSLILYLPKKIQKPSRRWWISLGIMLTLTAIFDPIIVALDIVAYDSTKITGLLWFGAPIEDFFYALYAATLVPLIWKRIEERKHE